MQEQLMFWHKYTCLKCTTGTAEVLLCYHIKTHQLGHWAQAKCEYTSGTETPVQLQNGISLHTECTSGSVLSLSLFVRSHPFQFSTFFPLLNAVECLPIRAATSYPPLPPEGLGSDTITCSRKRQSPEVQNIPKAGTWEVTPCYQPHEGRRKLHCCFMN